MFAHKLKIEYRSQGTIRPCPMKWLDSFCMRNFTNQSVFDDTMPIADGLIEAGKRVPVEALKTSMEEWFHKKTYLKPEEKLSISEG